MDRFIEDSVTYVKVNRPAFYISHRHSHFFMGSCFASNLYHYMGDRFFNCSLSPFGNIYNPLSLAKAITFLCSDFLLTGNDIFEYRGLWNHFAFDTDRSRTEPEQFLEETNRALTDAREQIRKCSHLYLTLGTAFVYRLKKNNLVVNNCHKIPSNQFNRDCASIEEMKDELSSALKALIQINPSIKIVLTLSPVRHLRDNPVENSLSKARLRCLIDELSQDIDFWYFPAYEIMLDQLRDYRWYGDDMTHPSQKASDYIMERFFESSADEDCHLFLKKVEKIRKRQSHRVLHPDREEAREFRKQTAEQIAALTIEYPENQPLQEALNNYENGIG